MRTLMFLAVSAALSASAFAQAPAEQAPPATPSVPAAPAQPAAPAVPATPPLGQEAAQINRVTIEIAPTQGNNVKGQLVLSPDNHGLRITGNLSGLKAKSEHAFHIHQNGDCSAPDAMSAGDHFNPSGAPHGNPTGDDSGAQHHAGDMPNLTADDKGNAKVDLRVENVTLGDGGENDVLGKAVIVHADPDDYSSQPAGNAGARIACGVISMPLPVPAAEEAEEAPGA
jgi:Cu-Zn family superoxide dismutase